MIIKQVSILLRQIITSKKWLHQSGSKSKSVNKINTSLGLVDTNKDKNMQNSKCTNIYKRKKTKHKKVIFRSFAKYLPFNKFLLFEKQIKNKL